MVHAIVLDGFHRNTVIHIPHVLPTLKVPREARITMTNQSVDRHIVRDEEYRLAFIAPDGEVALYSSTGRSLDFLDCDAVHPALTGYGFSGKRELNYFIKVENKATP